jgi:hypothetical protein
MYWCCFACYTYNIKQRHYSNFRIVQTEKQFWCIQALFFNNLLKYNKWTKCVGQKVYVSFTIQLAQNTVFLS